MNRAAGIRLAPGVLFLALVACCSSSCASAGGRPAARPGCPDDPRLVGSWSSYRTSQVGPSWMKLRFDCGCVFRTTAQLLWARVGENGHYRVEGETIVFERPSGIETRWPYAFEGDRLRLEEYPGELHLYQRTGRIACEPEQAAP